MSTFTVPYYVPSLTIVTSILLCLSLDRFLYGLNDDGRLIATITPRFLYYGFIPGLIIMYSFSYQAAQVGRNKNYNFSYFLTLVTLIYFGAIGRDEYTNYPPGPGVGVVYMIFMVMYILGCGVMAVLYYGGFCDD